MCACGLESGKEDERDSVGPPCWGSYLICRAKKFVHLAFRVLLFIRKVLTFRFFFFFYRKRILVKIWVMDRVERGRPVRRLNCSCELQRKGWILENRERRRELPSVDMISSVKLYMPRDIQ